MTPNERAIRALGLMAGGVGDPRDEENLRRVTEAIRDAVAAERERCARIASRTCRLHPLFADGLLQEAIATNIRNPAAPVPT